MFAGLIRFVFIAVAILSIGWTAFAEETEAETSSRWFFSMSPEFASGLISCGRVKVIKPVHNIDALTGYDFGNGLYTFLGVWSSSDLSGEYTDHRRRFSNEIDPIIAGGWKFDVAPDVTIDSCLGAQWNYMDGYEGPDRISYDEWQVREAISNPYATPWFAMRNFYAPESKASFRVGLMRTFVLSERWSLSVNSWFDGGGERWNRQRFGYHDPSRIRRGLNSASLRLFLNFRVNENIAFFGGVTGYHTVIPAIRAELRDDPSATSKYAYAVATCGFRFEL